MRRLMPAASGGGGGAEGDQRGGEGGGDGGDMQPKGFACRGRGGDGYVPTHHRTGSLAHSIKKSTVFSGISAVKEYMNGNRPPPCSMVELLMWLSYGACLRLYC